MNNEGNKLDNRTNSKKTNDMIRPWQEKPNIIPLINNRIEDMRKDKEEKIKKKLWGKLKKL